MLPVNITVSELVKAVKDSSSEQFRTSESTPVWRTVTVRLIKLRGTDASSVGSRNVYRKEWSWQVKLLEPLGWCRCVKLDISSCERGQDAGWSELWSCLQHVPLQGGYTGD